MQGQGLSSVNIDLNAQLSYYLYHLVLLNQILATRVIPIEGFSARLFTHTEWGSFYFLDNWILQLERNRKKDEMR